MNRIAWSLRRLHVPVNKNALVLDIGSGGNPYSRANVLLDAYADTVQRFYAPLIKDRPMVFGFAEKLPFKNKVFDFIITSHILEHMANPETFLEELQRVGKAGYIETPDAFFERICPYTFHRLEVTNDKEKLIITKKDSWCPHKEIVDLYSKKLSKDLSWGNYLSYHPEPFYTRYYWNNNIKYTITNPDVSAKWELPVESGDVAYVGYLRRRLVAFIRWMCSQRKRNRKIDLIGLLGCPTCSNNKVKKIDNNILCGKCGSSYPIIDGIPHMYPNKRYVNG